jgi:hypothetical protein
MKNYREVQNKMNDQANYFQPVISDVGSYQESYAVDLQVHRFQQKQRKEKIGLIFGNPSPKSALYNGLRFREGESGEINIGINSNLIR